MLAKAILRRLRELLVFEVFTVNYRSTILRRWASSKSHSPELSSPIFLKMSIFRIGWIWPSITKLSTCKPFCTVRRNSKSVTSFRSSRWLVGAIVTIGWVILSQTKALERITQVRPLWCSFRLSSAASGITTLVSSAKQTSPGAIARLDAPADLSAERRSICDYSPAFSRSGRQSSNVRRWVSSRSLSSPLTERSTGSSRNSSMRDRGRVFGKVAMSERVLVFREGCDTQVYLKCQGYGAVGGDSISLYAMT